MKTDNELIAELENDGYYVSPTGLIGGKRTAWLATKIGTSGYLQVLTYKNGKSKTYLVHRLVAMKYVTNPHNKPEVNHKDGNKMNNNYVNLEWVTRSENIKHGIDTGLIKKSMQERTGKKHWRSKVVIQSKQNNEINRFNGTREAARITGFNAVAIQDACTGKLKTYKGFTWKYQQ